MSGKEGRLMVSDTSSELNRKAEPSIKDKWTNHFLSSLAGWDNMNKGIHQSFPFDEEKLRSFPLEWQEIVEESYRLLAGQGFIVRRDEGLINVDIFDMHRLIQITRLQLTIKLTIMITKRVSST